MKTQAKYPDGALDKALGLDENGYMPSEWERENPTLAELQRVAVLREGLERELTQARADAAKLARKAQGEGETVTAIARAAGVSRVTLYEMLKRA